MPEGSKITTAQFINGNDSIIIKAVFSDEKIDEYTPTDNAVEKEIAGQQGWIEEFNDGVCFDYLKDGKLVEIFAPDEKVLESILESADK